MRQIRNSCLAGRQAKLEIRNIIVIIFVLFFMASCAKPLFEAKEREIGNYSKTYNADPNDVYDAITKALGNNGYSIVKENLDDGIVETGWRASTADSHYIPLFSRKDYGVNGAYYKLVFKIVPEGDRTKSNVEIVSCAKSLAATLMTSGKEEKKLLRKIQQYLRGSYIKVTNIGVVEE